MLIRAITLHDAEFEDDDLESALEYQHERSLICDGCGHPFDESTDDSIKSAWTAERVICWGCAAKERVSEKRGPHGSRYRVRNRAKEN